jgi:hypothetical protein
MLGLARVFRIAAGFRLRLVGERIVSVLASQLPAVNDKLEQPPAG